MTPVHILYNGGSLLISAEAMFLLVGITILVASLLSLRLGLLAAIIMILLGVMANNFRMISNSRLDGFY